MAKRKISSRTAEAFLFSGRPNPQWKLSSEQMKNWKQQWDEAQLSNDEVERPSILGYTGCRLQNDENSYWIIFNGCVSFYDGGKATNKKDNDRQMEIWLLKTGPEEVKAALALIN